MGEGRRRPIPSDVGPSLQPVVEHCGALVSDSSKFLMRIALGGITGKAGVGKQVSEAHFEFGLAERFERVWRWRVRVLFVVAAPVNDGGVGKSFGFNISVLPRTLSCSLRPLQQSYLGSLAPRLPDDPPGCSV